MATPEAEAVAEPKIKPEDLREADPAKRTELLEPYQKDLGTMSSWQVDRAMNQAVIDGVLEVDEDGSEDDVFNGKEVLAKTPDVPEAQLMLNALKDRKAVALQEERFGKLDTTVKSTGDENRQVELLLAEVERAYRTREIDLQPFTPKKDEVEYREGTVGSKGTPAVKERAYQPEQPEIPADIKGVTRKEQAIKAAIEQVLGGMKAEQQEKFGEKLRIMAAQKTEILKDEETRRTRADARGKREAAERTEAARKAVEAATKTKADAKEREEQIMDLGLHQEVLKKGTKVENVDPSMRAHTITNPDGSTTRVAARVDRNDRLKVDMNVTSQSVVDEALKENEQHDLERQFGREGAVVELERREKQREQDKTLEGARSALADSLAKGDKIMSGGVLRDPTLDDFGPSGERRVLNSARAEAEAHAGDREVAGVNETFDYYQRLIDMEPDFKIQRELVEARKVAMEAERTRQSGITHEIAQRRAEAMDLANTVRMKSSAREKSVTTLVGDDPNAEEIADERRRAGNFDPVPILEIKKGGIFARDKYRGPKIIEHTYRSMDENNKNVVMLERRNRRTGKLISQTIFTTEKPLREHRTATGVIELPPRELHEEVDKIRAADKAAQIKSSGSEWGSKSIRDLVHAGFGTGGAFDNDNGILARNIRSLPTDTMRDEAANKLKNFKASGRKRRGGWLYWISDENLPLS